ncbi:MAG: class I SAM-dependent methyltransferase [Betaproteobacteria bacterium]|nr:MAG: class I SAM-dependent methyltransferase [Betaproteobacteria bacterium]
MLNRIKDSLRGFPIFYRAAQRTYYFGLFAIERLGFGGALHAWIWRTRAKESFESLRQSAMHPHRELVIEAVRRIAPFGSLLEVGCHSGPNLVRLARAFPSARFSGLDLNAGFIAQGRAWMREEGLGNVELEVATAEALAERASGSVDIVLVDAVLMYIGPERIGDTLRHMRRIARRGVVIVDWMLGADDSRLHHWYDLHWVHNYPALLGKIAPECGVHATRIPPEVWSGGGWGEYGTLLCIEIPRADAPPRTG